MTKTYETIIIGGGILGNSIAYYLSEAQQNGIAVIDKGFSMSGASGSNQGWVWVHSKIPAWYGELSFYSAELYKSLYRKIGDIEYRRTGGIGAFFTEEEKTAAEKMVKEQAEVGIHIDMLTRDEALEREPALSPDVLGATYFAGDGNVNPMRVVEQFMRTAKKQGVSYEFYTHVLDMEKTRTGYAVKTNKGIFNCRNLVLCGGIQSQTLGKMLDINIPVRPVRGQVIITEPVAPLIRQTLAGSMRKTLAGGMRQTVNGEILIGYSYEEAGFDYSTDLKVLGETAQLAMKLVPSLAGVKIVRSFGGLRPMPQDGYPIMSKVSGMGNLYVATMHSGITFAPLVGTLMSELITDQETSLAMDRFRLDRFA